MTQTTPPAAWWGSFSFHEDQILRWHVGPLCMWIQRLSLEWRVVRQPCEDEVLEVAQPVAPADLSGEQEFSRYVFSRTGDGLTVVPALADRPVVSRPLKPVHIPPGQEITFFVSSPLWLRLELPEGNSLLEEFPIRRPSDTWFGPSTQVGELCYASETNCLLSLDELPARPHRAFTPVVISNKGDDMMLLERLNLPVPYLSLYEADGRLWTQTVNMSREQELGLATVDMATGPPPQAKGAQPLRGPRRALEKNVLTWALSALFD